MWARAPKKVLLKAKILPVIKRANYSLSTLEHELNVPETYKEAISAISLLQTNSKESADPNNLNDAWKYVYRSGVTASDLDTLSVIHVAGTKGKSSACAISESILRSYGCKTGFFSSPHFISITERYHINGRPITEKYFSKLFWKLYNTLDRYKEHATDMPSYFKYLTILGLHIFFDTSVDVAIIETGVGGLYDSTNIVRNTKTIGITSVDRAHSNILGRNIEDVAVHKAGIIKPYSNVYVLPMENKVLDIIEETAKEKNANFFVVPDITAYKFKKLPRKIQLGDYSQNQNSSLGIQLAYDWLRRHGTSKESGFRPGVVLDTTREVIRGIDICRWPGMSQIAKIENKTVYMNGADNLSSVRACVDWFQRSTEHGTNYRCLLFHAMPNVDFKQSLQAISDNLDFETVLFVPDIHYHNKDRHNDCECAWETVVKQIEQAETSAKYWLTIKTMSPMKVKHFTSVLDGFLYLDKFYPDVEFDILITGSMSVIGAARRALDRYRVLTI